MKKTLHVALWLGLFFTHSLYAQQNILPNGFAPGEEQLMQSYLEHVYAGSQNRAGITTPPTLPIRTAAQWEESQALVITWTGFPAILREIVRAAQTECKVIIHCSDSNSVKSNLTSHSVPLTNLMFIEVAYNSIWIRDYGANTCYLNDVDSLVLVDWIYNRPRPDDDLIPEAYSSLLGIPLYTTTAAPNNLMNTGGNWMVDGLGTAFASNLILDENDGNGSYAINYPNHTATEIDTLMAHYHGINKYIRMPTLPYDGIHHIDMHMKFLDEKTLLVGEFPSGVSDGPQIEANIQYVLSTFTNAFGDPYKVVRVPMPPSTGGSYPGAPYGNGYYRTYSNFVIVNKTVIMPIYREEYDTTAVRVIRENMPGYKIVTIDADDYNGNSDLDQNIVSQSGVIHCITHLVGVQDPLRIVHNYLEDTYDQVNPYTVDALIQHKSGIANATLYWTTDTTQPYTPVVMTNTSGDTWTAGIPAQPGGSEIFYYIHAQANSGKQQVRPMPAPDGYWHFRVLGTSTVGIEENIANVFSASLFPNPSKGITCIPFHTDRPLEGKIFVTDAAGKVVEILYTGGFKQGESKFFVNTTNWAAGLYMVVAETNNGRITQKLIVR